MASDSRSKAPSVGYVISQDGETGIAIKQCGGQLGGA